jgi:hypothetical protein
MAVPVTRNWSEVDFNAQQKEVLWRMHLRFAGDFDASRALSQFFRCDDNPLAKLSRMLLTSRTVDGDWRHAAGFTFDPALTLS